MSCACPSKAVSARDPMVAAFDHFWPKGMPFPPAFPWLGAMFTRQNLFAGAVGGVQATPTPVEDGVVEEEEEDWGLPPVTPVQETVVKEGADIFGNVLVFPAPEMPGMRRDLVGNPSLLITRTEFDRITGGSRALATSLLIERFQLLAPEASFSEVVSTAKYFAKKFSGLRGQWTWILIVRSVGTSPVYVYDYPNYDGSEPPEDGQQWVPPESSEDDVPEGGQEDPPDQEPPPGSDSSKTAESWDDEDNSWGGDEYESGSQWGICWPNCSPDSDSASDTDKTTNDVVNDIIVDPCRRYPQLCHGFRSMLQSYVQLSIMEYRWYPVI